MANVEETGLLSVFVNKILLKHSMCIYVVCDYFIAIVAELNSCNRDQWHIIRPKCSFSHSLQKTFADCCFR